MTIVWGILVMNREHARLLYARDGSFDEVVDFISTAPTTSDPREGQTTRVDPHGGRDSMGDEDNRLHRHELTVFTRAVADALHQNFVALHFDRLLIVAPGEVLAAIRPQLATDLERILVATHEHNLVNFHLHDLVLHLQRERLLE